MAVCPTIDELSRALETGLEASSLAGHVASCPRCRARAERIGEDNALLSELGSLLESGDEIRDGTLAPGESIPGFEVVREVYRGGQGVVYEAVEESSGDRVAIKLLLQGGFATSRQRHRFEREIEIVSQLHHPNIVAVRGARHALGGRPGYVMEYIDGVPLDVWCARECSPEVRRGDRGFVSRALGLFTRVCNGVVYAHMCGVIHRDLKPANILVDGYDEPRILDFGIAKAVESTSGPRTTMDGEFRGTFAYASPEQFSRQPRALDVRIDVYALGVILYEMLVGALPFDPGSSTGRLVEAISEGRVEPPSRSAPWIDGELESVILKAVAKDPEDRYQSVDGLRGDVQNYLDGNPVSAKGGGVWYVLRKSVGRFLRGGTGGPEPVVGAVGSDRETAASH